MADLTRSDFVINRSWYEDTGGGKNKQKCLDITISTGTAGSGTNAIPASVLGLDEVYEVIERWADNADPGNYLLKPAFDGLSIVAVNLEQATDANRGDPADIAFATFPTRLIVKGRPSDDY